MTTPPTPTSSETNARLTERRERRIRQRIRFLGPRGLSNVARLSFVALAVLLVYLLAVTLTQGSRTKHLVSSGIAQRNAAFCAETETQFKTNGANIQLYEILLQAPASPTADPRVTDLFHQTVTDSLDDTRQGQQALTELRTQLSCPPAPPGDVSPDIHLPPITTK